jgi:hypothetical protein
MKRAWVQRAVSVLWSASIVAICAAVSWWTFERPLPVVAGCTIAAAGYAIWAGRRAGQHWVDGGRRRVPVAESAPRVRIPAAADPIVVYLRPFALDDPAGAVSSHGLNLFRSEEQQLGRAFADFGRLIAVGRPDEDLAPAGADRVYPGDDWRTAVEGLVRDAALVLVGAGRGAGLRWEIDLVVRVHDPRRTVILLPGDITEVGSLLRELTGHLPKPLPKPTIALLRTGGLYTAAVHFGADWAPYLVVFDRDGPGRSLALECRRTLAPVYAAAGHHGSGRSHRRRRGLSILSYRFVVAVNVVGVAAILLFRAAS